MAFGALFERIIALLNQYPAIRYRIQDNYLHVYAADAHGFPISVAQLKDGSCIIMFHLWFEVLTDEAYIFQLVQFGLSDNCRLRLIKTDREALIWTLQYKMERQWFDMSSQTTLYLPLGDEDKTEEYFQNHCLI